MAMYFSYEKFITSDNKSFLTSDESPLDVRCMDNYFSDPTNKQLELNSIAFGSYNFNSNKVKDIKIHYETGLLTDKLAIDTVSAEIISKTKPELNRYTAITVKRNAEVMGVFFNGQIKQIGIDTYSLYAESYISLLEYTYHYGGIYSGTLAGSIVAELMGEIPYTINEDVANVKIYGYLPYASCRDNLQQILIATGAAVRKNADGTINITVLTNTITGTFTEQRIYAEPNESVDTQVTAVRVTEHAYIESNDQITLYEGSFFDEKIITFSEPAHTLSITNGTILSSGANYAKVKGSGTVVLVGKKYTHTTRIMEKGTPKNTPEDKIPSVSNATLITMLNSSSVAERLYQYAKCNKTIKADLTMQNEKSGDMVKVAHPYTNQLIDVAIQSLDYSMSNKLKATALMLEDYVPKGTSTGYKNRVVISQNQNFTVPAGVTEIRAVLIGGGNPGTTGNPGTKGSPGSNTQTRGFGASGKGGKPGIGGDGGKVLDVTISVTPEQIIPAQIGKGGIASKSNNTEATLGEATTFGTHTSNDGVVMEYVDIITTDRFSVKGDTGNIGGDGGQTIYTDDGVYNGGMRGHGAQYRLNGSYIYGDGGEGGGAAIGSDGFNGSDGKASANNGYGSVTGGPGGTGATPTKNTNGKTPGSGGDGGHGGAGGGGGGNCYHPDDAYAWPGEGGSPGNGGEAGDGADGCIIIYY